MKRKRGSDPCQGATSCPALPFSSFIRWCLGFPWCSVILMLIWLMLKQFWTSCELPTCFDVLVSYQPARTMAVLPYFPIPRGYGFKFHPTHGYNLLSLNWCFASHLCTLIWHNMYSSLFILHLSWCCRTSEQLQFFFFLHLDASDKQVSQLKLNFLSFEHSKPLEFFWQCKQPIFVVVLQTYWSLSIACATDLFIMVHSVGLLPFLRWINISIVPD